MIELSEKQREIVESKEKHIVVISSPASGKTTCAIERIKYLINNGVNPKDIVAITFTNLAAEEMRQRIGLISKDCFIGTVHAYCNYLLLSAGIMTSKIIEEEKFDELFMKIKEHPDCAKPVKHLLLDEAQDSDKLQFEFLLDIVKPENYMLIGDFRQSIYQFKGSRPDLLIELSKREGVTTYDLNENYRNSRKILDYAKMIIRQNGTDYIDKTIPMRDLDGEMVTVKLSPNAIAKSIKKTDKYGDYGEWFVLCRTNQQVEYMRHILSENEIPISVIRRKDFSTVNELEEKMRDNTVKVMTIHQSKGLEAKNVVVIGAILNKNGTPQTIIENACLNYVAATRAKDLLVWTYEEHKRRRKLDSWE